MYDNFAGSDLIGVTFLASRHSISKLVTSSLLHQLLGWIICPCNNIASGRWGGGSLIGTCDLKNHTGVCKSRICCLQRTLKGCAAGLYESFPINCYSY